MTQRPSSRADRSQGRTPDESERFSHAAHVAALREHARDVQRLARAVLHRAVVDFLGGGPHAEHADEFLFSRAAREDLRLWLTLARLDDGDSGIAAFRRGIRALIRRGTSRVA